MTGFASWQTFGAPTPQYAQASPNLRLLAADLAQRFHMRNLGIYNRRPIRGGTAWSSHAFGAALDVRYESLQFCEQAILPWLIENADRLGVQRIHHYARNQYWQAGKGWVNRTPGQGGDWLHIEVHPTRWADTTPIADRLKAGNSAATPAPKYPARPLKLGSTGKAVQAIQTALGTTADGKFGPVTDRLVRNFQTANRLTADGIVGPKTWAVLFPNA